MFSGSGAFVKHWNNVVTILALYNSIVIPVQLLYGENGYSEMRGSEVHFIDACVDLFFLMDIIVRFRTTFLDPKEAVEIRDPHIIGLRYIKGTFTLDFISSVPFSSIIPASGSTVLILDALGRLKLLRLTRLY